MFRLRRPSRAVVEAILAELADAPYSYDDVGATAERARLDALSGYAIDRYSARLGAGDEVFDRARDALFDFAMYPAPWTEIITLGDRRPAPGLVFASVISHFGFWSINPGRVIGVTDSNDRASFGFGTLPGHAERGEERFSITRDGSGEVRFEALAFSRPAVLLARLGAPVARSLQRRFSRDARSAMRAATS